MSIVYARAGGRQFLPPSCHTLLYVIQRISTLDNFLVTLASNTSFERPLTEEKEQLEQCNKAMVNGDLFC
eukprot:scaffold75016_cov46-Cyclotella_meneghiniana.AAC.1